MDTESNTILENTLKTSKSKSSDFNREEFEKQEHQREVNKLLRHAHIPKRHSETKTDADNEWSKRLEEIIKNLQTGMLYALLGKRGTGKTQFGVCLIRYACRSLTTAKYSVAMDFFMEIKATYKHNSSRTEDEVIVDFVRPSLLVLDEMHERGETEWENRLLTYMIDKRYTQMKDTLLISNQTLDVFQTTVGYSILSRLQETGAIITCDWPSFREEI